MKIKKQDEIDIYKFNFYQGCQTGVIIAAYKNKTFLYNVGIPIASSNTTQWYIFDGWAPEGFNLVPPKKEYYNILDARIKNDLNGTTLERLKNLIILVNLLYDLSESPTVYIDHNEAYSNKPNGKILFKPFNGGIIIRSDEFNYPDLQPSDNTSELRLSAYNTLGNTNVLNQYLIIMSDHFSLKEI